MTKKLLSRLSLFAFVIATVGMFASPVTAANFLKGEGENLTVLAPASETFQNLYVAGADVLVNSAVTGDLYAVGADLTVDGGVEQDLTIIGGTVKISSPVGGDVRVAGGTVLINSNVSGDVVILGGNTIISDKATIGGQLIFRGSSLTLDAPVTGNVDISAETVSINSMLSGEVKVKATREFRIGEKTQIAQSINYTGSREAIIAGGAQVNEVRFDRIENNRERGNGDEFIAAWIFATLIKIIALGLAALVLTRLFARTSHRAVLTAKSSYWKNLGIGFVAIIAVPVISIVLMITGVGFYLAIILMFLYFLMLALSVLLAMVLLGAEVMRLISSKQHVEVNWHSILLGVLLFTILSFIPVVGWLAMMALIIVSLGGLVSMLYDGVQNDQTEPHVTIIENN